MLNRTGKSQTLQLHIKLNNAASAVKMHKPSHLSVVSNEKEETVK